MNVGNFEQSLDSVYPLLREMSLFGAKGYKKLNKDGVSDEFKRASYKGDYFSAYKAGISNFDYDFLLKDNSFFQFTLKDGNNGNLPDARYAFFQNPQEYITYEQYIEYLRGKSIIENETNDEIGLSFVDEYEQHLIEQQLNLSSTTIRYDVDEPGYIPLIHSVSHIHIGHINNVRIPCNRILSPMKFVLFVIKHVYYYEWKNAINNPSSILNRHLSNEKLACGGLNKSYWQKEEEKELFLS